MIFILPIDELRNLYTSQIETASLIILEMSDGSYYVYKDRWGSMGTIDAKEIIVRVANVISKFSF